MKTRNNSAMLIITSGVCLLPIILSFILYNELPEQIAIHWNSVGNADNFVHKAVAAFGLPFLFLAINLFSKIRLYNDPKQSNTSQVMQVFSTWTPPLLSLVLVPITLFIAMGANIPISSIVPVFTGIVLLVCGNYLPKSRQNYTIGIKLPWTLLNADNWNKTHRMAGYLWIIGGITLIAGTFISFDSTLWGISMTILVVIPLIIIPVFYSYWLYKKTGNDIDRNDN